MTHLRIELNNTPEIVSTSVVAKLYELASSGTLDLSSNLAGYLLTSATYLEYIDYLCKTLLNPSGMFPDLVITATTTYMMFEDPEVEAKLKNWVGDGTGVVASLFLAATTLPSSYNGSSLFFQNTVVTKFNELSRAINLTTLADSAFKSASNLELINISNITSVGQSAFSACKKCLFTGQGLSNLQHMKKESFQQCWNLSGAVSIHNLLDTDIKDFCFLECKTMASITIPTTVTALGTNVFLNCTALTTATGFSNVTSIGNHCFNGCSALTSIDIDFTKVTSLGNSVFTACSNLFENLVLTVNATIIDTQPFRGTKLKGIILPSVTELRASAFSNHGSNYLKYVECGPNLTTINSGPFWDSPSLTTLVFRSTTVPTYTDVNNRNFLYSMSNLTIYVPDASLNDYKTTGLWANMADHIKGISELPSTI